MTPTEIEDHKKITSILSSYETSLTLYRKNLETIDKSLAGEKCYVTLHVEAGGTNTWLHLSSEDMLYLRQVARARTLKMIEDIETKIAAL